MKKIKIKFARMRDELVRQRLKLSINSSRLREALREALTPVRAFSTPSGIKTKI